MTARLRRMIAMTCTAFLVAAGWALSAREQAFVLRYDLQVGDHLVYRERLVRRSDGEQSGQQVEAEWTVHVLAVGACPGCVVTGFQRNRTFARLTRSTRDGRDTTTADQSTFAAQLALRPATMAEANWVDAAGVGHLPWLVTREWRSLLLPAVHEFEPLPVQAVKPGDSWAGQNILGYRMTALACPGQLPDDDCLLLEGKASWASLRLWYSRTRVIPTKIAVSGVYSTPFNVRNHEEIVFDLVERRRGERLDDWLSSPEVRAGTLSALQISASRLVPAERLYERLSDDDAESQRGALAVAWAWGLSPPPSATIKRLLESKSARVRTLAARFATRLPESEGRELRAAARADTDWFVREAASAAPDQEMPAAHCAPVVESWRREQRHVREQPGATLRVMTSPGFEGWPYVVRVPDDYTGAHPVPAVVYLSGGPGLAVPGAQTAEPALANTGYLGIFPQADGLWWDEKPRAVVRALLDEVIRAFAVDTSRVFLAGFSNGGTGTLIYASLWPDRFAAAAPTMAAGVGGRSFPAFLSSLDTMPLLLQHGRKDGVIPVDEALENRRRLTKETRSAPFDLVLLDDREHDITIASDEGRTLEFLARHRRDAFPPRVVVETSDLRFPRRYWVEIVEKGKGVARLDASTAGDGVFEITAKNVLSLRLLLRSERLPSDGSVVVRVNGREAFRGVVREDCALLTRTLSELADPGLAYSAVVQVKVGG